MYFEAYKIARIGEWAKRPLFRGGVRALGGDRAFHQQDEKGECDPNHGEDKECVEIGERGGLLLTKIFQRRCCFPVALEAICSTLTGAGGSRGFGA
jgi:hypothetical protein